MYSWTTLRDGNITYDAQPNTLSLFSTNAVPLIVLVFEICHTSNIVNEYTHMYNRIIKYSHGTKGQPKTTNQPTNIPY